MADSKPTSSEPPSFGMFPEEVVTIVLLQLNQKQRALAALCCRRWAYICATSHLLWQAVTLDGLHPASRSLQRVEGFLAWLIPRAANVQQLAITERRGEQVVPPEMWGNCVAAITLLAPQLRSLTLELPVDLTLSAWAGALQHLQLASFSSDHVVVREGLNRLSCLTELRLRSSKSTLTLEEPAHSMRSVLPTCLIKLRLEGCNLNSLPPAVTALTALEDLVLSDNILRSGDMQGLSCLVSLRQLTLMGCRMRRVPSSLSHLQKLQVIYLDMGIAEVPEGEPIHLQIASTLGPLRHLGIVSLGACYLQEFPSELASMASLRALYLDDNAITVLPEGPYLAQLCVLGIDWRVLLTSHRILLKAPRLRKICLMSVGKMVDSAPRQHEDTAAVVETLTHHPSLQKVLLPQVDGQRCQLHLAVLNIIIGISKAPRLDVAAVGYQGIDNEWLQWLEQEQAKDRCIF